MSNSLDLLIADGIIDAVISRLKSGKEAEIYLVEHKGEIVAAKIYKEQHARNFKHRAAYSEGRSVRNSRTQRAIDKGSRFGKQSEEDAWKATESDALHRLFAAGLRVPQPVIFYEGVLLMEVVIDAAGHPAPRLIDAHIPPEKAAELYADLRAQTIKMLTCDLIHGDLSPYNVLMAWNGPTIIDFPQVVGAAHNPQAEKFFARDLDTLHKFFAQLDPALRSHADDARQIWKAYERRELTPDFVPVKNDRPPKREFVPDQQQRGGARRHGHPSDRPGAGEGHLRGGRGGHRPQGGAHGPAHGAGERHGPQLSSGGGQSHVQAREERQDGNRGHGHAARNAPARGGGLSGGSERPGAPHGQLPRVESRGPARGPGQRREGRNRSGSAHSGAPPRQQGGGGPVVSYVGQANAAAPQATAPNASGRGGAPREGVRHRRRRRHRGGSGGGHSGPNDHG